VQAKVSLQLAVNLLVFNTNGVHYFGCRAKAGEAHLEQIGADKKSKPKPAHFSQIYLVHKVSGGQAAHDDNASENPYCTKNFHSFPQF